MRRMDVLWLILLLALALRLLYALSLDPAAAYRSTGGDQTLYLQLGYNLMTGYDYSQVSIPTAPLYLVFNGLAQRAFSPPSAILALRLLQAVMSTTICFFAYDLARAISGERRAGLLAAAILAVSPAMVIESAQILTETLYMFLVYAALWLYSAVGRQPSAFSPQPSLHITHYSSLLPAILLGLAALTRAVLLAFPLGLALYLLVVCGWRAGLKRALLLLLVYSLTLSTWTIWNAAAWGRCCIIGAEGFMAFLYIGASGGWDDPEQVDRNLAQDAGVQGDLPSEVAEQQELYRDAAANIIGRDLGGWITRRLSDLAEAYLQPHGTIFFSGESLKDLAASWLAADQTLAGLLRLTQGDAFWPKLTLYALHYLSLLAGLAGLWWSRRHWRAALPLAGFILYTTLAHLFLDAIPRYLFPLTPAWWAFAAIALVAAYRRLRFGLAGPRSGVSI